MSSHTHAYPRCCCLTAVRRRFGLLHALPDAASGIVSSYPYAYLIAGSTALFLIFVSGLIEPLNRMCTNAKMPKELVNVNSLWCALLVHGCFEGLATGALATDERWVVLGVLFVHKIVEYAALTAQMATANLLPSAPAFWLTLLTAEIPTLVCFVVAWKTVQSEQVVGSDPEVPMDALFAALSAGTFLFLALSHLIPDALGASHSHSDDSVNLPDTIEDEKTDSHAQLGERIKVLLSIGLGWTVFALFSLSHE